MLCRVGPDLEWKLTYVGSAESEKYDQVLDSVLVGPIAPGQYRFVFQVDFLPTDYVFTLKVNQSVCAPGQPLEHFPVKEQLAQSCQ